MKKKQTKKRKKNMQDATLVNIRAVKKRVFWLEHAYYSLTQLLSSKGVITPAQARMLEEALR